METVRRVVLVKAPGAVIALNPYAAAAKCVLAGWDLEKIVKQTASMFAAGSVFHLRAFSHQRLAFSFNGRGRSARVRSAGSSEADG